KASANRRDHRSHPVDLFEVGDGCPVEAVVWGLGSWLDLNRSGREALGPVQETCEILTHRAHHRERKNPNRNTKHRQAGSDSSAGHIPENLNHSESPSSPTGTCGTSLSIRPSTMRTTRLVCSATSGSWVTRINVCC